MYTKYTIPQALNLQEHLLNIFDVVRFVDPFECSILDLSNISSPTEQKQTCFHVWGKFTRCDNCTSLKTLKMRERITKFEFINDDIFHITSKPLLLQISDTETRECVLEIVSKITDEVVWGAYGKGEMIQKILLRSKMFYIDSLSNCYNRRYFDERIFMHSETGNLGLQVSFVMCDIKEFKYINDTYGHEVGDFVIRNIGTLLLNHVRSADIVIRVGGDEFLIIFSNCTYENAAKVVKKIQKDISKSIIYAENQNSPVVLNCGIASTSSFSDNEDTVRCLLKQADDAMYAEKKKSKISC